MTEDQWRRLLKRDEEEKDQLAQAEGAKAELLRQLREDYGLASVAEAEAAKAKLDRRIEAAKAESAGRYEELKEARPDLFGE